MPEAALLRSEPVELVSGDADDRPEVTLHAVPERPAPIPRLEIPPYDLRAAMGLRRALGVSHVLAQVLVRRGITDPTAAVAFLDPKEAHEPSAFGGIDRAVSLIERHIRKGSR